MATNLLGKKMAKKTRRLVTQKNVFKKGIPPQQISLIPV